MLIHTNSVITFTFYISFCLAVSRVLYWDNKKKPDESIVF